LKVLALHQAKTRVRLHFFSLKRNSKMKAAQVSVCFRNNAGEAPALRTKLVIVRDIGIVVDKTIFGM
jgi:hypothetical protein